MRCWYTGTVFSALLLLLLQIIPVGAGAAVLSDIQVKNSAEEATVTMLFSGKPVYVFFPLHTPERVVIDLNQKGNIQGIPLNFNGKNLIHRIRSSQPVKANTLRLVFDLTQAAETKPVLQDAGKGRYRLIFRLKSKTRASGSTSSSTVSSRTVMAEKKPVRQPASRKAKEQRVIVAIDAGHGGTDPGAIGQQGLKEKNVTIAIARKLEVLLNNDPMFSAVLTRKGDYFVSVPGRSEVARKQNANVLVSIHADAAPNFSARGASVWVLSNRRANNEMANWLEQHEKQSELLGGAGDVLANTGSDRYLSQAVLDLQFGHSQRVGYDIAVKVLRELQSIGKLHKHKPEHASLGVLRSPDIPSLLVETGFISNRQEEQLLGTAHYQDKIARSIHKGLKNYFLAHPLVAEPIKENRPQSSSANRNAKTAVSASKTTGKKQIHVVKKGETLSGIAAQYGVSMSAIREHNKLKKDVVWIGQRLTISP